MYIGEGRKEACQHIKIELESIIKVTIPPARKGHIVDVRCVDMYRHLGTQQTSISSIVPLLKIRNAATKPALTAVKKAIFRYELPLSRKVMFTKMYIFSKYLFDAGTWPLVNKSEEHTVHTHVLRIYRSFFHQDFSEDATFLHDVDFLIDNALMAPASILRLLRLSLFSKIIAQEHINVLAALFLGKGRARSFMHAVTQDLRVVATLGEEYHQYQGYHIAQWIEYIRHDSRRFLRDVHRIFSSNGSTLAHIPISVSSPKAAVGEPCICQDCGKIESTYQQLQLHRFRKHGWLHPAHMLINNTYCRICLTEFHTRTRLLEHIMYKGKRHRCLCRLQKCGEVITHGEALELNSIEAKNNLALYHSGHKRSYAAKPAHRVCGPLPNHALILKLSQ